MKKKSVLLWVLFLFLIDQIVKIVINRYFIDLRFSIIPPLLYFQPTFNLHYSWINGLFNLGMGFWTHMLIFSFVTLFIVLLYDFMKTISGNDKLLNIAFVFVFAGMMSSFVGTIIWNGCLDYIYLKPLFVFDLKDLYVTTFFLPLSFLYQFKNREHLSSFTHKDIVPHFKKRYVSLFIKRED